MKEKDTTYAERVQSVLGLFCTEVPPMEIVEGWLYGVDDERLQRWVLDGRMRPEVMWAQGIGLIDAARVAADDPEETRGDPRRAQHADFDVGKKTYDMLSSSRKPE